MLRVRIRRAARQQSGEISFCSMRQSGSSAAKWRAKQQIGKAVLALIEMRTKIVGFSTCTVRPRGTRPRGTQTLLGHDFKKGSKILAGHDFAT